MTPENMAALQRRVASSKIPVAEGLHLPRNLQIPRLKGTAHEEVSAGLTHLGVRPRVRH